MGESESGGEEIVSNSMHLKPDPEAVQFLLKFGLTFVLVIVGAIIFMRYRFLWGRSKSDDERKENE